MDTNRSLETLTVNNTKELVNTVEPGFIRRWGSNILVAINGSPANSETDVEQRFKDQVDHFLSPKSRLDTINQLAIMREFWDRFGYSVPGLSEPQQAKLTYIANLHPSCRVVPTPLLTINGRQALIHRASEPADQPPEMLDKTLTYNQLLINPGEDISIGRNSFGLRYKTLVDGVVNREEYLTSLKAAGQTITAEDGTVWTFPVMDVRVRNRRTKGLVSRLLLESVDPTVTTEALIATRLLHLINGERSDKQMVDIANEAVYELHKTDDELARVVGVELNPTSHRRIQVDVWKVDQMSGHFCVRTAYSGL